MRHKRLGQCLIFGCIVVKCLTRVGVSSKCQDRWYQYVSSWQLPRRRGQPWCHWRPPHIDDSSLISIVYPAC
ncbi:hypothetical protein EV363DRAFT_1330275 [Boletus edulis]|uniref:Secreted protein n=1 Tax=Boletus edulis BED1 TaxID=1328754 RepID=A0AAD4BA27_BOLED|nr:hypothetical protein EV363DRAFT_1330275 [Boletus edulis]KAF8414453.1 hypothetical protein L210DRAFT_3592700 [Boletus edulis BED1]